MIIVLNKSTDTEYNKKKLRQFDLLSTKKNKALQPSKKL